MCVLLCYFNVLYSVASFLFCQSLLFFLFCVYINSVMCYIYGIRQKNQTKEYKMINQVTKTNLLPGAVEILYSEEHDIVIAAEDQGLPDGFDGVNVVLMAQENYVFLSNRVGQVAILNDDGELEILEDEQEEEEIEDHMSQCSGCSHCLMVE